MKRLKNQNYYKIEKKNKAMGWLMYGIKESLICMTAFQVFCDSFPVIKLSPRATEYNTAAVPEITRHYYIIPKDIFRYPKV